MGITRDSAGNWGDASGPLTDLPWCPNEPNNNAKDGAEGCANLLTGCTTTGAALLNDFACDKLARVVCAVDSTECGELVTEYTVCHSAALATYTAAVKWLLITLSVVRTYCPECG